MKKEEIPQDKSPLKDFTREIIYAKDKSGKLSKGLSTGWDAKSAALDLTWSDIEERIAAAKEQVAKGLKSPVYYFMEKTLMDPLVLSGYTGYWRITVKRHFKPAVFKKLSDQKLMKYAKAFEISLEELKYFDGKQ